MIDTDTVPGLLEARASATPNDVAHMTPIGASGWGATTWVEYQRAATHLAHAFQRMGLSPGDRIGILAPTCQYWDYSQMAVLAAGGVVVGLDPYDLDEHINQIATRTGLIGVIVKDATFLEKLARPVCDGLKFIVYMDPPPKVDATREDTISNLLALPENSVQPGELVHLRGDDPATIVFTSGTTGAPKGIVYTHRQVRLACDSILEAFPEIQAGSHLACWLPLSNLFQRIINYSAIGRGAITYFVDNPRKIVEYLPSINPHLFIGVPRFYEKLYEGIMDEVQQRPPWVRHLITWALSIGDSRASPLKDGRPPKLSTRALYPLADALVLRRLRAVMGSNLPFMISGSAPMPHWLLDAFNAMGLLILEAYGTSENIIPIAVNTPQAFKFGTVGRPMRGSEVKLSDDGELMVRGPGVFAGYYNEPAREPTLDADGYLATGDYASIDEEGFVTLVGRKAEIFKTSTGRRIAPVGIENVLRYLPYVEHAVVFGENRKYLVALLTIQASALRTRGGLQEAETTEAGGDLPPELITAIRQDILEATSALPRYKRPVAFLITLKPFTVAAGELTANLKLRRRLIQDNYQSVIDELYAAREQQAKASDHPEEGPEDMLIRIV